MNIAFITDTYMRLPEAGLIPDPFRQGVIDALGRLGHTVTTFLANSAYFEERCLTPLEKGGGKRLAEDVAAIRPHLVLTINRAGLCPEVLALKGPRFASWYIDQVHSFPPELLEFGERELVFFFGPRSVLEPGGAPEWLPMQRRFYLPLGVDARAFRPRPEIAGQTGRRFNILFLGGYFSSMLLWKVAVGKNPEFYHRLSQLFYSLPEITSYARFEARLLEVGFPEISVADQRLLLRGMQSAWTGLERVRKLEAVRTLGLTIYGGNWEAMIPEHMELLECYAGGSVSHPDIISQLFSLSRLTVNITHLQSRMCGGLNLRVFEALSTGTLLVNDHPDEIGTMFEDGVEFLSYRDDLELRDRCEWALANPEEAGRIAEAGRRAVMSDHTLQHRLVELLRTVEEAG